ncbi:DUF5412 family protein [Alkalihalobacillus trypoxylicola]|nr:DUF5412 family protein [Alkalihalobacillus trypoxylicola]
MKSYIKKKPFPKKVFYSFICSLFLLFTHYVYVQYFFTFDFINKGDMQIGQGPILSPTEKYSANAYYELYGGAAGGVNVWVEVTDHQENNSVKTVYYSDAKTNFFLKWVGEYTLEITNKHFNYPDSDRSIELDVTNEIYHENGAACKSLLLEFTTCYQHY